MAKITTRKIGERIGDPLGTIAVYMQQIETDYTDYDAAATSDTVDGTAVTNVRPLPLVLRYMDALFEAPTASAAVVELGDSGDPNGLADQVNAWGDGDGDGDADTAWTVVTPGADAAASTFHASWTPQAKLTLTADNCEDLTAGGVSWRFYYEVVEGR